MNELIQKISAIHFTNTTRSLLKISPEAQKYLFSHFPDSYMKWIIAKVCQDLKKYFSNSISCAKVLIVSEEEARALEIYTRIERITSTGMERVNLNLNGSLAWATYRDGITYIGNKQGIYFYNPASKSWSSCSSEPQYPGIPSCMIGKNIIRVGGTIRVAHSSNVKLIRMISVDGNTVAYTTNNLHFSGDSKDIYAHTLTNVSSDSVILAGGTIYGNRGTSSVYKGTLTNDEMFVLWRKLPSMMHTRQYHAAFHLNGELYVVGGYTDNEGRPSNSCEMYDTNIQTWGMGPDLPYPLTNLTATTDANKRFAVLVGIEQYSVAELLTTNGRTIDRTNGKTILILLLDEEKRYRILGQLCYNYKGSKAIVIPII